MSTALIVLDFINDIVHPAGKISGSANYIEKYQVINQANKVIASARKNNNLIIFCKVGFSQNYVECPTSSPIFAKAKELGALQLGTWGTEFHEDLNIKPSDPVIIKHRVNAFHATTLDMILRENKIENLLIAGVSTDMAVQTTARDAHDRDYKVTVVSDACGAGSLDIHESTLTLLQRVATITSSESVSP